MKNRLLALGLAGAAVLTFSSASVFAMPQGPGSGARSGSNGYAPMEATQNSPAMHRAMAQFHCSVTRAQSSRNMSSHMNGAMGSEMMEGQMMGGR